MAVDTPTHRKGLHLFDPLHLIDTAVASRTTNAYREMRAVIEVHMIGKFVYAVPGDGPALGVGCANRKKFGAVRSNLAVAFHANLGRWYGRKCTPFRRKVAEPTVHAHISGVKFVTELHWLKWTVTDIQITARPIVRKRCARK